MIKLNCDDWSDALIALRGSVKKWYCAEYASDKLGKEIPVGLTFWDVVAALNMGIDIYAMLDGAADSVVRERIFSRIADIVGCGYDTVYNTWMGG